jgi:hypothetical protein
LIVYVSPRGPVVLQHLGLEMDEWVWPKEADPLACELWSK